MVELTDKLEDYEFVIKAGLGGNNDKNIFAYFLPTSNIASTELLEDTNYNLMRDMAIENAEDIVRRTGKDIKITYSLKIESD